MTQDRPLKSYGLILEQELGLAEEEIRRPTMAILTSGLLAGLTLGTSIFLGVSALTALGEEANELVRRVVMGQAYAVGFVLVIFARADLFTEYTTIAILPVLLRRSSVRELARLWGLVYASNMIGALLIAGFLLLLLGGGTPEAESLGGLSRELLDFRVTGMLASAVFAGWLMGLLSWLVIAARETISQIVFVWIVGASLGLGPLHHSITGTIEVATAFLAGAGASAGDLGSFILWSTLGNAIGGVAFALLIRQGIVSRGERGTERGRG